jgi:hypothetical protein
MNNTEYGTCLYIRCDYEVGLWFLLLAVVFFGSYWLIGYISRQLRLRECRNGKHRKITNRNFYHRYSTTECECGKFKYLHDDEDGLTLRMK